MRMSCNGCRVLRKGCSENCSIRPCLQWMKNPESQANATVFLAKFYGRAGIINLIDAGPDHLRPAIFRSLLYEACGRIVNPIYGSVGLLWAGNWQLCQAAVEAVLKGAPILQISSETAAINPLPLLHKAMVSSYDIRHVSRDDPAPYLLGAGAGAVAATSSATQDLHKVNKSTRTRFKRSGAHTSHANGAEAVPTRPDTRLGSHEAEPASKPLSFQICDNHPWRQSYSVDYCQCTPSHESSVSQRSNPNTPRRAAVGGATDMANSLVNDSKENESVFSVETVEGHVVHPEKANSGAGEDSDVELELALGLGPGHRSHSPHGSGGSHDVRRGSSPSRRAFQPAAAELPYRCDRMTTDGWFL